MGVTGNQSTTASASRASSLAWYPSLADNPARWRLHVCGGEPFLHQPLESDCFPMPDHTTRRMKPVILIIRDGWGASPLSSDQDAIEGNAVRLAVTPIHDELRAKYPLGLVETSGENVGLPAGQMGNSEVGHLNLGAGRIVYQDLTRINKSITDGHFFQTPAFHEAIAHVKEHRSKLHLMGLCSDGGVHSHLNHLVALLEVASREQVSEVFIHCFTDGRDTAPNSGADFLAQLSEHISRIGVGEIASIIGRYYGMDRDNRWERIQAAYNCLVDGSGAVFNDVSAAMHHWFDAGITDEFVPATVISKSADDVTRGRIASGDAVIFFNFRSDRARQITRAFTDHTFNGFARAALSDLHYVCLTEYDETFPLPIAFPPDRLNRILGQVLAEAGLRQLRVAETEKYPHVTFFFNGGVETPLPGEDRLMIPSPKVATYDLQPEMNAFEVTTAVVDRIRSREYDVIILNFANADMVGHTGSIPAAIKAVETVDKCVGDIVAAILDVGGVALITADHGNAEKMLDDQGRPFTAHTTYPVELIYVADDYQSVTVRPGILADVAPTILDLLGLAVPPEMTGRSLLTRRSPR